MGIGKGLSAARHVDALRALRTGDLRVAVGRGDLGLAVSGLARAAVGFQEHCAHDLRVRLGGDLRGLRALGEALADAGDVVPQRPLGLLPQGCELGDEVRRGLGAQESALDLGESLRGDALFHARTGCAGWCSRPPRAAALQERRGGGGPPWRCGGSGRAAARGGRYGERVSGEVRGQRTWSALRCAPEPIGTGISTTRRASS